MADAGFKLVINYGVFDYDLADIIGYADYANAVGMKVIWDVRAGGDGTFDRDYIRERVEAVKTHPATWGYYVADEPGLATPNDIGSEREPVKTLSDYVWELDPAHPRFLVHAVEYYPNDSVINLRPYADYADVIAVDVYPLAAYAPAEDVGKAARAGQELADENGKQWAIVLQSFDAAQYKKELPDAYAGWPDRERMLKERNLALENSQPAFILWYSYFDILRSSDPAGHWADLVAAAFSPGPPIEPTSTLETTPALAEPTSTQSIADYYVSPAGSNSNDGSVARPWRTIQYAADQVMPGTTVYVLPGTYNETFQPAALAGVVTAANGTLMSPIQFICTTQWACLVRTDATATPACVFPDFTSTCTVWDNTGQYVTIQGFDISGTNIEVGIAAAGSYSKIIGNRIHDLPAPCTVYGAAGVVTSDIGTNQNVDVIGNLIFNIGANTTANITSISRNAEGLVTVTTATSHRIDGAAFEVTIAGTSPGSTGLSFNGKFVVVDMDVPIMGTIFTYQQAAGFGGAGSGGTSTDSGGCGHHSGIYAQIPGSKIQNNILHNNIGSGIGGSHRLANATISNNLLFRNQVGGIEIGGSPTSLLSNMTVTNNIILNNGGPGIWEHDLLDDIPNPYYIGSGNVYRNNLVWNNSSLYGGVRGIVVCNGPLTNCGTVVSTVSNTLVTDPQFVFVNYRDDGMGDYHLRPASPAIDAGTNIGAPSYDFDGAARPQGTGYDRGPYEFQSPTPASNLPPQELYDLCEPAACGTSGPTPFAPLSRQAPAPIFVVNGIQRRTRP